MGLFRNVITALDGKTGYLYIGSLLVRAAKIKVTDDMVEVLVAEPVGIPAKIYCHIDNVVLVDNA